MKKPEFEKLLDEFVSECKKKFGDGLVSIILFGSYARGTAREASDIDILVVAENLPRGLLERMDIMDDFVMHAIKRHSVRIMPVFYEPEDFDTKYLNPLIFGILTGYRILFDAGFWHGYLASIKAAINETDPEYIEGESAWRVKELI